jgi:hypothetical protein
VRNRFDQLGKQLIQRALDSMGRTTVQLTLNAETLFPDVRHQPDPACAALRGRLGLLGRLTEAECLIELFSDAPDPRAFRACLAKHVLYEHELVRAARRANTILGEAALPDLWIISAGAPRTLLDSLVFEPAADCPRGVYRWHPRIMRVGLVVAGELPLDRSTLLVRLMAGGRLAAPAIREVRALAIHDPIRLVAEQVLLEFHDLLVEEEPLEDHEREFVMEMHKTWNEIRNEARLEGRLEGDRHTLRRLLSIKFGELPAPIEAQVARASQAELERFLERVLSADSLAAVFEPPITV